MENTFSTSSAEIIQKQVDLQIPSTIDNVDNYFDIEKIYKWIVENDFKRTALQFPDNLLSFSPKICKSLQKYLNDESRIVFVLGDTSYGSCCVDLVAAEHYAADSLVHFGHSCLSKTEKLPVFHVFEKFELNIEKVRGELDKIQSNRELHETKIVIVYDVSYYHHLKNLKNLNNENIYVSDLKLGNDKIDEALYFTQFSRIFPIDLKLNSNNYIFFYIGNTVTFFNALQMYFNSNKFVQFVNSNMNSIVDYKILNRKLMRRFYLIEKAKDSRIFGILVGTMAVSKYKEAIDHVSSILKRVNRKYYSFLIGKLNCAKLNNFMEVDMYVLIACHENSIIDSKELNKPVISMYELEMAFNSDRVWGKEYVSDYQQLLVDETHYVPFKLTTNEYDVSLISNHVRSLKIDALNEDNKDLIKRDDSLSVIHYNGAGEFLKNRSWTGLEQCIGETPVVPVVEGRKGIAMGYASEPI